MEGREQERLAVFSFVGAERAKARRARVDG